ncbi:LuxR C-terminal-related transcriptional regulator [Streptomyces sp. NPDC005774]|uniref:LuxR C-terminal-related transcriptional regulator n=1 Tax=Streptomyces sp. NPDC005774 TaxID=3364728 RepID=UPI00369C2F2C
MCVRCGVELVFLRVFVGEQPGGDQVVDVVHGGRHQRDLLPHARRAVAADPALAGVRVVILTNYGLDEHVFNALRAGAAGFLVKDIVPEDFLHAVRVAARGDALLAPAITRRLINRYVDQPPLTDIGPGLKEPTSREREAVVLVARGLSNDEIAGRLVISPLTAKTHVNRAMAKLHARDRAQLVVLAYESGLVAPRDS